MKKHTTRVVDEEATDFLKSALPKRHWQIYDQTPDIAKDHTVELVENGDYTGKTFIVQLKGTRSAPASKKGFISFSIGTRYLKYFMRLPVPVFLILIDLRSRKGYWLFVQGHVSTLMGDSAWQSKRSTTLKIPDDHTLDRLDLFREQVTAAIEFLKLQNVFPPEAVISAERKRLEETDPRFSVNVSIDENGKQYTLSAREPVPVRMTLTGSPADTKKRWKDLIEKGLPINIEKGQFLLHGSKLLEDSSKEAVRLEIKRKVSGLVSINRTNAAREVIASIPGVPFSGDAGTKEARIDAELPHGLAQFRCTARQGARRWKVEWTFLLVEKWSGQRLLSLPYFEEFYAVFGSERRDSLLRLLFNYAGQKPQDLELVLPSRARTALAKDLERLKRARYVARHLHLDPVWPEAELVKRLNESDLLFDLLTRGEARRRVPNGQVFGTTQVLVGDFREILRAHGVPKDASFPNAEIATLPFFGTDVPVRGCTRSVEHVDAVGTRKELQSRMKEAEVGTIQVSWRASRQTEIIFRMKNGNPFASS